MDGAPGEIRTPDLMLRRHSLYPAELRAPSISISYFESHVPRSCFIAMFRLIPDSCSLPPAS